MLQLAVFKFLPVPLRLWENSPMGGRDWLGISSRST